MGRKLINLNGNRYGRLTVVSLGNDRGEGKAVQKYWKCLCDCGKYHEARGSHLKSGNVQSCGCLNVDSGSIANLQHGMNGTRTYKTWVTMRQRCNNQNNTHYKDYMGRGISVCDSWNSSFEAFYADMGDRPAGKSIDRIDNNGNYEPSNCKWSTPKEQSNNRRCTPISKMTAY